MIKWKRWLVAAALLFLMNWLFVVPQVFPDAHPVFGPAMSTLVILIVAATTVAEVGAHLRTRIVLKAAGRLGLEQVATRRTLLWTTRWVLSGPVNGVMITIRMQYHAVGHKYSSLSIWVSAEGNQDTARRELVFDPFARHAVEGVVASINEVAAGT